MFYTYFYMFSRSLIHVMGSKWTLRNFYCLLPESAWIAKYRHIHATLPEVVFDVGNGFPSPKNIYFDIHHAMWKYNAVIQANSGIFRPIQACSGRFRHFSLRSVLTSKMDSQTPNTCILTYVTVCYLGLFIQIQTVWPNDGFDIKCWFLDPKNM